MDLAAGRPLGVGAVSEVTIRRVEQGDLPALTDIYNYYVRETPVTFDIAPRTLAQRQSWLDGFAAAGRYQCFVAVKDGQAVGWASSHRYHWGGGFMAPCSKHWLAKTSTVPLAASASPTRPRWGCMKASASGWWGRTPK